jgi:hypothetical protein
MQAIQMALMAGGKYPLRSYRYPGPREKVRIANKSKDSLAESQSRAGIGYKAGKSDTPLVSSSRGLFSNMRGNIPTIRACVASGGSRERQ